MKTERTMSIEGLEDFGSIRKPCFRLWQHKARKFKEMLSATVVLYSLELSPAPMGVQTPVPWRASVSHQNSKVHKQHQEL